MNPEKTMRTVHLFKLARTNKMVNSILLFIYRYWNCLINSFRDVWIQMARRVGAKTELNPLYPIQMYKQLFIQSSYLIHCIKNKTAFDQMTLEGHRGRVMAIKYNGDAIATGILVRGMVLI